MKVCEKCGVEIGTKDGDNQCGKCERKKGAAKRRKERDEAMRSCGLVKVKGALGGTYWE
jgi:uncharacterized Zn finger protein (UPF0148 family)